MAAPNLKEIEWAISELEAEESSMTGYTRLAALYTCRNEMLGTSVPQPQIATYSEAAAPISETLDQYGDSEFLQAVSGKDPAAVLAVMDELMDTLRVLKRRAYEHVIQKLQML